MRTTRSLATSATLSLALSLCTLAGCDADDAEGGTAAAPAGSGSTSGGPTPSDTDPSGATGGGPGSTSATSAAMPDPPADDDTGATTADFIVGTDAGSTVECDVWQQDCPEGEKCMPWANDGGIAWNATRCAPVSARSAQPGEPCTAEGGGLSGIDSCAEAAMCWNVDPETNEGTCVSFCEGTAQAPSCSDSAAECSISLDGVLTLCLPSCDPLDQNCPTDAEACYPGVEGGFQCYPDYSGETGAYGDPCEFTNVCDPGLFCAPAYVVPGCTSALCCSEFCDVSSDDPDSLCSGQGEGQLCTPWYEEGQAPPGEETIGYCSVPA